MNRHHYLAGLLGLLLAVSAMGDCLLSGAPQWQVAEQSINYALTECPAVNSSDKPAFKTRGWQHPPTYWSGPQVYPRVHFQGEANQLLVNENVPFAPLPDPHGQSLVGAGIEIEFYPGLATEVTLWRRINSAQWLEKSYISSQLNSDTASDWIISLRIGWRF